jgi:hypothetical protein
MSGFMVILSNKEADIKIKLKHKVTDLKRLESSKLSKSFVQIINSNNYLQ